MKNTNQQPPQPKNSNTHQYGEIKKSVNQKPLTPPPPPPCGQGEKKR